MEQRENVVIAGAQSFLRADCNNDLAGKKAHCCDPSTGNQWIEAWWSYFCRSRLTWWINIFKDLVDHGVFYLAIHFMRNAHGCALQSKSSKI